MPHYRLSSEKFHAPRLVAWAKSSYRSDANRPALRKVFANGFGLPDYVADMLLHGEIDYTIDAENAVVFEVGEKT